MAFDFFKSNTREAGAGASPSDIERQASVEKKREESRGRRGVASSSASYGGGGSASAPLDKDLDVDSRIDAFQTRMLPARGSGSPGQVCVLDDALVPIWDEVDGLPSTAGKSEGMVLQLDAFLEPIWDGSSSVPDGTNKGDILYWDDAGDGEWKVLSKPTSGAVLTWTGSALEWELVADGEYIYSESGTLKADAPKLL